MFQPLSARALFDPLAAALFGGRRSLLLAGCRGSLLADGCPLLFDGGRALLLRPAWSGALYPPRAWPFRPDGGSREAPVLAAAHPFAA